MASLLREPVNKRAARDNAPALEAFRLYRLPRDAELEVTVDGGYRRATRAGQILTIGEQAIELVQHEYLPIESFRCPRCGVGRYRLYFVDGEWACRACQRLVYASQRGRLSAMLAHASRLRARLGVDPVLFSTLDVPLNSPRRRRLAFELRQVEEVIALRFIGRVTMLNRRYERDEWRRARARARNF